MDDHSPKGAMQHFLLEFAVVLNFIFSYFILTMMFIQVILLRQYPILNDWLEADAGNILKQPNIDPSKRGWCCHNNAYHFNGCLCMTLS